MHEDSVVCKGCGTLIDTYATRAYPCHRCRRASFCGHECYRRNKKYHANDCKGSRKALRRRASTGSIKDVIGRELSTNATLVERMHEMFRAQWNNGSTPGALILWMADVKDLQTLLLTQGKLDASWFNWSQREELERHGNRFAELLQMMDRFTPEDCADGSLLVGAAVGPRMVYSFWVRDACPTPR